MVSDNIVRNTCNLLIIAKPPKGLRVKKTLVIAKPVSIIMNIREHIISGKKRDIILIRNMNI